MGIDNDAGGIDPREYDWEDVQSQLLKLNVGSVVVGRFTRRKTFTNDMGEATCIELSSASVYMPDRTGKWTKEDVGHVAIICPTVLENRMASVPLGAVVRIEETPSSAPKRKGMSPTRNFLVLAGRPKKAAPRNAAEVLDSLDSEPQAPVPGNDADVDNPPF